MLDLSSVVITPDKGAAERELLRLTNKTVQVVYSDSVHEMLIYLGDDAYEITATFNCEPVRQEQWKFVWLFTAIDPNETVAALIRAKDNGDLIYWSLRPSS